MRHLMRNLIVLAGSVAVVTLILWLTRPKPEPCGIPANHGKECVACERLRAAWAAVDDEAFWVIAEAAGGWQVDP